MVKAGTDCARAKAAIAHARTQIKRLRKLILPNNLHLDEFLFSQVSVEQGYQPTESLRQRRVFRLRRKWKRQQAHEKHQTHRHARGAHRRAGARKHSAGEIAERQRTGGRDKAPDVIAEARARRAKMRGEQFRQINRVAAEQSELAKSQDRKSTRLN